MKDKTLVFLFIYFLFFFIPIDANSKLPLRLVMSSNIYKDLSDTYGGGSQLSASMSISKDWYGSEIALGYYHSQTRSLYEISIEEINKVIEIPIEDMTIMTIGTFSGIITPISSKYIEFDILFGLSVNKSKSIYNSIIDYKYSTIDNKFLYLIKDYTLVIESKIGYQIGLNFSLYPTKRIGFQLNARLHDFCHGGTCFLLGCGLCVKI